MSTHNLYFRAKNKKNVTIFHLKITIFTAVKYCSILHGHVCVMVSFTYLRNKISAEYKTKCWFQPFYNNSKLEAFDDKKKS